MVKKKNGGKSQGGKKNKFESKLIVTIGNEGSIYTKYLKEKNHRLMNANMLPLLRHKKFKKAHNENIFLNNESNLNILLNSSKFL